MKRLADKLTLILLALIYLICSYRYFPDRPADSLYHTLKQLLSVAPFAFGITLIIMSIFHRTTGERLPWDRGARIFFTIGIIIEFFFGLYNYLNKF